MWLKPLFIGGIGMQELLLIMLVVLLFFGGKKIPEMMKGLGKGVRSFKEGMNEKADAGDEAEKPVARADASDADNSREESKKN